MRRALLLAIVVSATTSATQAAGQAADVPMSGVARAYLGEALDTLENIVIGRDTLPWAQIRDSAFQRAWGARTPAETWGAVAWALQRANPHSFLQAPRPGAVTELIDGRYGYLRVPARGGPATALADSLHGAIGALEAAGACGWVVDVRGNGGGNMWPMLAGVGPLLGDTVVGYFGGAADAEGWYYRGGISGIIRPGGAVDTASQVTIDPVVLQRPDAPVAVLMDGGTASSGEGVVVAFMGRPRTRTFGTPTAGFATANRGSVLPDGANMVVTTGYYADRRRAQSGERLTPDQVVEGSASGWPYPTDRAAAAATAWLAAQPACAR